MLHQQNWLCIAKLILFNVIFLTADFVGINSAVIISTVCTLCTLPLYTVATAILMFFRNISMLQYHLTISLTAILMLRSAVDVSKSNIPISLTAILMLRSA